MTAIRRNVATAPDDLAAFTAGVLALKNEGSGSLSTYDAFVLWHHEAMHRPTPPTSVHGGPVFLPWHRYMLMVFEAHLQRVLRDNAFGIPYWNWWDNAWPDGVGAPSATGAIIDGPFAFTGTTTGFSVVRWTDLAGVLHSEPPGRRGLSRTGLIGTPLPGPDEVVAALRSEVYDKHPWRESRDTFRAALEGFVSHSNQTAHNACHAWIGGDMESHTSPNDPIFFLLHSGVDRVWAAWEELWAEAHPEDTSHGYAPQLKQTGAAGHSADSRLVTMSPTQNDPLVADVLGYRTGPGQLYQFDDLSDLKQLVAVPVQVSAPPMDMAPPGQ